MTKREVLKAGLLGGTDAVLGVGAGALPTLDCDHLAIKVGQGREEPVAVVVGEGELRAGCGRSRRTITR